MGGKWCHRFVDHRLDGLSDDPRPSAPRTVTDDRVEAVVLRTLQEKPEDATHRSTRSMAKEMGMSRTTINRIWSAFGLQPPRSRGSLPRPEVPDPRLARRCKLVHAAASAVKEP